MPKNAWMKSPTSGKHERDAIAGRESARVQAAGDLQRLGEQRLVRN